VAVYRVSRSEGKKHLQACCFDPDTFDVYELWEDGLTKDFIEDDDERWRSSYRNGAAVKV